MSNDSIETDGAASPESSDGMDRRRAHRYGFEHQCNLMLQSPPWAITMKPITGTTENITDNGLRVTGLHCDPGQAEAWREAAGDDVDLKVEITLPDVEGFPILEGRIVWVFEDEFEAEAPSNSGPVCSVGILFSIMRDRERKALQGLLGTLPT
ncbi:hypothetical protein BH09SUM1_BH09SUM1_30890 [soil metagenome]